MSISDDKGKKYLLDTHSLYGWVTREDVSSNFIDFIDTRSEKGLVYVSSVSFWEIGLLAKKGRIYIKNLHTWKNDLINYSPARVIDPTADEMIDSTLLPDIHKDPFDRLLIAQAKSINACFITKDTIINKYKIKTMWI